MGKNIHTVTIGDQTFTRESDSRAYTHAVVVTCTDAERTAKLGKHQTEIDELEATIARASAQLADPGQDEAYAGAIARIAYLEAAVTEPLAGCDDAPILGRDGTPVMHTCARWLSATYRAQYLTSASPSDVRTRARARDLAMADSRNAREALEATARGALEKATADLERARGRFERASNHYVVGAIVCENWSQSAKGAAKLADDARKDRPLAIVTVTDDIHVRVRAGRGAKKEPPAG